MRPKILTVTIPTWNRVKLLDELLTELIEQITSDDLDEKVEILISNNGSEDETEKLVLAYKARYNFIIYNNNGTNKGARYNVLKSMQLAGGEYLILFGDDDRPNKGVLKKIVNYLLSNPKTGSLFDSHLFKRNPFGDAVLSLPRLLENFYYYLGNAGLFIIKSKYIKDVLIENSYDFFSPTWPQTQIFILAAEQNIKDEIRICNLNVLAPGMHNQVMIYTSYYLWRTTYLDLVSAIESIKDQINYDTYHSAKKYYKKNVIQLFFNILQCGVFLDNSETRLKTAKNIFQNLAKFSFIEKSFLAVAAAGLFIPVFITRILSNIFIYLTRGTAGIKKKNDFINKEIEKRKMKQETSTKAIREFDFTNV